MAKIKRAGMPRVYPNTTLTCFITCRVTKTQAATYKKLGSAAWLRRKLKEEQ